MKGILPGCLLLTLLVCSGCWNYQEVNERLIVLGVAMDYDEAREDYELTVEVAMKQTAEGFASEYFNDRGKTIFDAIRNLIISSERKLYWGQIMVIVVSPQLAERGMIPVLDMLFRGYETGSETKILVANESRAARVFNVKPHFSDHTVSYNLFKTLESEKSVSLFHAMPLWEFVKTYRQVGIEPVLPLVTTAMNVNVERNIIAGNAVFKADRMVGSLTPVESKYYLIVSNQLLGGLLVVNANPPEQTPIMVTLEVFDCQTESQPSYRNNQLEMQIKVSLVVNIAEIDGLKDVISKPGRLEFKKNAEEQLERAITNLINKVQKDYQSDIFGFGATLKRKMPKVWKQLAPRWEQVFSELKTQVSVELQIRGSALTRRPIQIAE